MTTYRINERIYHPGTTDFEAALVEAHARRIRPVCMCLGRGVEMYVAKIAGKFYIKRMPGTGAHHAPVCDSYEEPQELSGLGQVMGTAITENPDDGLTNLKLNFSLTKMGARAKPLPSSAESDSVKTDGNKLTLRGTLHFLWKEAGFHRWSPSMEGKRNWFVVRKYLLDAAANMTTKGAGLVDVLYIPESWSLEHKNEIATRRISQITKATAPIKGAKRLMIVIGEIKEISPSRYSSDIIFKHLPDFTFHINEDLYARLKKRFSVEMALCAALEGTHLMAIGTFSVDVSGLVSIEELALMATTENWIPFDNTYEKELIDGLTHSHRRFVKGLRYNLPSSRPLACLVANDTLPTPTALYIIPPNATEDFQAAMHQMVEISELASWIWNAGEDVMPSLPVASLDTR
jgi:hypothetical protein